MTPEIPRGRGLGLPQPDPNRPPLSRSFLSDHSALAWAFFLACSWTWCIGMYLPVLLVRDYGAWGWVVFAVPNVVGAAAMGWTLRDAEASRRVVANHHAACVAFSAVTIAFHVFFGFFFVRQVAGISPAWLAFPVAGFVISTALLRRGRAADRLMAIGTFAVSIAAFLIAVMWSESHAGDTGLFEDAFVGRGLLWLAPVCVFGFALCPYLDLTFHRARQHTTPAGGKFAFTVGFFVFFLAMIVFTLWYAGVVSRVPFMPYWHLAGVVILIHVAAQLVLTVALHAREIRTSSGIVAGVGLLAILPASLGFFDFTYHGLSAGEIIYRCFMGMYGLTFPAYVWICMLPNRSRSCPVRRDVKIWASAVVLACPFFWVGFIERHTFWLLPGLLIVLLARVFVRGAPDVIPAR